MPTALSTALPDQPLLPGRDRKANCAAGADAAQDESWIEHLENDDHIRRHRRLVAIERAEALRMRLFLDRTEARPVRSSASPLNLES